jgi:hypothetical protein
MRGDKPKQAVFVKILGLFTINASIAFELERGTRPDVHAEVIKTYSTNGNRLTTRGVTHLRQLPHVAKGAAGNLPALANGR